MYQKNAAGIDLGVLIPHYAAAAARNCCGAAKPLWANFCRTRCNNDRRKFAPGPNATRSHAPQAAIGYSIHASGAHEETVNTHNRPKGSTCIIGFDLAWTDNSKAPGAVCAIVTAGDGGVNFKPPCHVSFDQAFAFIDAERRTCDTCLVALDQPTIVPNETGSRPVDKVAASLISFIGGGVQPANRSKKDMFGDDAPVWRFLKRLGAKEAPELSRTAEGGLFIIEVFRRLHFRPSRPGSAGA